MSSVFPSNSTTIEGWRSRAATVVLLPIFMEERRHYYNYDMTVRVICYNYDMTVRVSSDLSMLLTMASIEPGLLYTRLVH